MKNVNLFLLPALILIAGYCVSLALENRRIARENRANEYVAINVRAWLADGATISAIDPSVPVLTVVERKDGITEYYGGVRIDYKVNRTNVYVSQEGDGKKDGSSPFDAMPVERLYTNPWPSGVVVHFIGSIFYGNTFITKPPSHSLEKTAKN